MPNRVRQLINEVLAGQNPRKLLESIPPELAIYDLDRADDDVVQSIKDTWQDLFGETAPDRLECVDTEGSVGSRISAEASDWFNTPLEDGRVVKKVSGGGSLYTAVIYKGVKMLYGADMGFYSASWDKRDTPKVMRF